MRDLPTFYTQAGNFRNEVEGAVDPRTGMYNVAIKLGEIIGNNGQGPAFPVTLTYRPLAALNGPTTTAFGQGVSLSMTIYDTSSAPCRLSLSNGKQYVVDDDTMTIRQKKLDEIKFVKESDSYKVTYRSGDVEFLKGPNDNDLQVPSQLTNSLGHSLFLHWDPAALVPELSYIVDDVGAKLLSIDYSSDVGPVISFYPDQQEGYTVQLGVNDTYLQTVTNYCLGQTDPLTWTLSYDQIGQNGYWGSWVTGVTAPGGSTETQTESVVYPSDGTGAGFADSSLTPLPQVSSYTRDPGCGQPLIVSSYEYFGGSFLGAGSGGSSDGTTDALYGVFGDYQYGSVETRQCNDKTIETSRTYNQYHLLADEVTSQDDCKYSVHTEYGALKKGYDFDHQEAYGQCPTKKTHTWSSSSGQQQQSVVTEYDEQGNLTKSTPCQNGKQCGPRKAWEFYIGDGTEDGCPKDPLGFVARFVKSVSIEPCSTLYSDVPVLKMIYTYSSY